MPPTGLLALRVSRHGRVVSSVAGAVALPQNTKVT